MAQPNCYFDNRFNSLAYKLLPGEYFVTDKECVLVTVLGSCVSVCLRDPQTAISGMNHFLLPCNDGSNDTLESRSARYGMFAMELLINQMLKMGAARDRLEAKVFGGGSVLDNIQFSNVGEKNVAFIREYLQIERIPIIAEDLLDKYPRKIYFFPVSGRVLQRKLKRLPNDTIIIRERRYQQSAKTVSIAEDAELFE